MSLIRHSYNLFAVRSAHAPTDMSSLAHTCAMYARKHALTLNRPEQSNYFALIVVLCDVRAR